MMLIPGFPAGLSVCSLWGQLLREADLRCQEDFKIEITRGRWFGRIQIF